MYLSWWTVVRFRFLRHQNESIWLVPHKWIPDTFLYNVNKLCTEIDSLSNECHKQTVYTRNHSAAYAANSNQKFAASYIPHKVGDWIDIMVFDFQFMNSFKIFHDFWILFKFQNNSFKTKKNALKINEEIKKIEYKIIWNQPPHSFHFLEFK